MKAICLTETGGPEVLTYSDAPEPAPADNEILIEVIVAGVNYIDTYYREGVYFAELPFVPGKEGVGRVVHDPAGEIANGTKVAWCDGFGSYAEYVTVPRDRLVAVPQDVDDEVAASMLLQGITAHYLTHSTYELKEGDSCLITAGAGGVGLLATQFAKARGATVYSVVSSDEKEKLAYEAGADEVFRYSENLAETVRRRNGGAGVDVVYDGVGKATFQESLEALRPRGLLCLFGAASGAVEPLDPQTLNKHGSIYLTRPSIGAYTSDTDEFTMRAQAVVQALVEDTISIKVSRSYPLAEAAQAHRDLQARKTTGSIVLRVKES